MGRDGLRASLGVFVVALWVASCGSSDETGILTDAAGNATEHELGDATSGHTCDGGCATGAHCSSSSQCQSHVCKSEACEAPSPTDGVKNDSETDVDCGGVGVASSDGAPACPDGKSCHADTDCKSTLCVSGTCVAASCGLSVLNDQETDLHCGGPVCPACGTGKKCNAPRDCTSLICTSHACAAATDSDGVENGGETDVDCGGGLLANGQPNPASDGAPVCAVGKTCQIGSDCAQGVCAAGAIATGDAGASDASPIEAGGPDGGASARRCQPATSQDGVKNDSESDVDCGGALLADGTTNTSSDGAPACASGKACSLTTDCLSVVCTNGVCQSPSATDGVKNDSETDIDCGGSLLASGQPNPASDGASACADGKVCALGNDCIDLVCNPGPVTTPSTDGSPIDCAAGQTCTCQAPTMTDGVKNDSETDVDCGGDFVSGGGANASSDGAPLCAVGQACLLGTDCVQGVCNSTAGAGLGPVDCPTGDTCACQAPASTDGVQNDSETDVDCGGALLAGGAPNASSDGAPACPADRNCLLGSDCESLVCATGVITTPSANGKAIDCPAGKSCTCQVPAPNDGVKNDSETDIDCGGKGALGSDGASACADEKTCLTDGDCLSTYCSTLTGRCVAGQSCKGVASAAVAMANGQHAGLDTCGTGETSDAVQAHESCCRSLLLPTQTTVRLDKYEVTAGRMRQFVESVNAQMQGDGANNPNGYFYDLRDWATSQIAAGTTIGKTLAAQIPSAAIQLLPQTYYNALNIIEATGATTMDTTYPSQVQGCFTDEGAAGASTYWWPEDDAAGNGVGLVQVDSPARPYAQAFYDIKSMNCAPYYMYAAFCAWDGGFLPSLAQVQLAYGNGQYPWTPTAGSGAPFIPNPYPVYTAASPPAPGSGYVIGDPNIPNFLNTVDWNNDSFGGVPGLFYFWPNGGTMNTPPPEIASGLDYSSFIASPGRFPLDVTLIKASTGEGWQDLGANLMEATAVTSLAGSYQFCDCGASNDGETSNCTCTNYKGVQSPGVFRGPATLPSDSWEGGSWEGHYSGSPDSTPPWFALHSYDFPIFTQYGKFGLRCARNAEP